MPYGRSMPARRGIHPRGRLFVLAGDWWWIRRVLPPAGDFLLAQKVTKDAHETNGFVTSFSVGKRIFGRTWPKF